MIDLEPYIYRPHPIYRLPSREDAAVACETEAGEKEFRDAMLRRGKRIYDEFNDPYRFGYEPEHWAKAEKLLDESDELLISGGNRSGKTEFAAKYCIKTLMSKKDLRVICFHTTHQSSLQTQQPVIHKYLPVEYRRKIKSNVASISYSVKNGFTGNAFILPNGSQCHFMHYSQDRRTVEGLEADLIWADELIPFDLLETLRYRLITRSGKLIVSFTPIEGYSMTVKDMISGGEVTEWKDSELLPGQNLPNGPEGEMPFVMRCRRPRAHAIWFHTKWNPYNPYTELKKRLYGLHDGEVKVRAYGWATATAGNQFPRFGDDHIIEPGKIPDEGMNFMVADPAGSRNWCMIWGRVVDDCVYIYREWPDRSMGDWAVPSHKADGSPGPAQKSGGGALAIWQYKQLIEEIENGEEIFLRLIDPRAASNRTLDGNCILDKLHLDEYGFGPMHFYPASGKRVDEGVALINDLLYFDPTQPIDDENYPRLHVSKNCPNLIYALKEWTYVDGDRGSNKDFADCLRYLVMDDNLMVEEGCMESRGGGSY